MPARIARRQTIAAEYTRAFASVPEIRPIAVRAGAFVRRGLERLDQLERGEELEDLCGELGVPLGILGRRGTFAAPAPAQVLLGELRDRVKG